MSDAEAKKFMAGMLAMGMSPDDVSNLLGEQISYSDSYRTNLTRKDNDTMTDQEKASEMTRLLSRAWQMLAEIEDADLIDDIKYDLFENGIHANPEIVAQEHFENVVLRPAGEN